MKWIGSLAYASVALFLCVSNSRAAISSSQDLGSVLVNNLTTLTIQLPGLSETPNFHWRYNNSEFSLVQSSCTGAPSITCTLVLKFQPQYPGLRLNSIQGFSSSGILLANVLVHGIGLAPLAVLRPGIITNFAGIGTVGNNGDNGPAISAELWNPQGLALDTAGNLYIADSVAQVIRRVDTTGNITTVAGNPAIKSLGDGGPATSASLNAPTGVAVDAAGNLYIADSQNNRVRRVDAVTNHITTVAGTGAATANLGDGNLATAASLNNPTGVAIDTSGNLFIADQYNNRIRRVDAGTGVITTVAGGGIAGSGTDGLGDGGPATNATLNRPSSIAFDAPGNLYIADTLNHLVREVSGGTISVVAGNGTPAYSEDGIEAVQASLNAPAGIRVDGGGNLYIADSNNSLIRKVNSSGIISTLAGQPNQFGFNSNNVLASNAQLNNPTDIAIDPSGTLYVADQGNSMVRKIAPGPSALSFDPTVTGTISSPQVVTIDNIGNQAFSFSTLRITGNFLQQSSDAVDCSLEAPVPTGTSCSVAVAFAPQAAAALSGALTFQTASQTMALALSGSGTGTGSASSDPALNATTLVFPNQSAGVPSTAQIITLSNPGPAALSMPAFSLSGSDPLDFGATTTCPNVLAPNTSCTFSIVFTPGALGGRSATLNLSETHSTTNAQLNQSVFLYGIGIAPPTPAVSPTTLTFNNTGAGTLPVTQTVVVSNASSLPVGIFSISTSQPNFFSIASACQSTLAAQSSCAIAVTFTPTTATVSPATLTITFDSGLTQTITLTTANPVIAFTGPTSSLGPQTRNLRSVPVAYGFQNLGSTSLTVSSISIGGTNGNDFQQVNNCGTSVSAGQGCTIWLTYLPTGSSPVSSSAAINIRDGAPGSPHSISITGTATGLSQALIDVDSPSSAATVSGTIPMGGWIIDNNAVITAVTLAVDGVAWGTATYGISRPDVCAAYPGRPGCPNVGWGSSLNTTLLADGAHTLTVTAASSFGHTTVAVPFTVTNPKPTTIDIDYPNIVSVSSGTANFAGWAINSVSAISSIKLSVDGIPVTAAAYGISRPDVCTVYPGRPGCPNVGWIASVDTRQFSNGQHLLAVTAQTSTGAFTTATTTFRVANAAPAALVTCIDSPGASPVSGVIPVSGWAIDAASTTTSVTLLIDGVTQGTASTIARPDVCAVYKNTPGCPNVGWAKSLDTSLLPDGTHTLGVLVRTADAKVTLVSKSFSVANLKNTGLKTTLADIDWPTSTSGVQSGPVEFTGWTIDGITKIANTEIFIDGVPVSAIPPTISRRDVCAVYPSTVGCPLVGWGLPIDTSSLSDGAHSLQVTATSQGGVRATATTTFATSNAGKAASQGQFIVMDYPLAGGTISGSVTLAGWAVNATGTVQKVMITVDGVPAGTAFYGILRPDVCNVLRSTGCPNVGWSYTLNTAWLTNGTHTLRAIEYATNGCTTISRSVIVANAATSLTIDIDSPSPGATFSGTLHAGGWVIDNQSSVAAVIVAVDGVPIAPAQYGISRPDVCAVYPGRAGCPNVGWSFSLDTTLFANGAHTLQITALSSQNTQSTVGRSFVVAN